MKVEFTVWEWMLYQHPTRYRRNIIIDDLLKFRQECEVKSRHDPLYLIKTYNYVTNKLIESATTDSLGINEDDIKRWLDSEKTWKYKELK